MARQSKQQPANRRPVRSQGGAADFTQKRQAQQQPKRQAKPQKQRELPESNPGEVLWKLALILCTAMVIAALLFASINGGSRYVGLPEQDTNPNATPAPPTAIIDPALNVTGSDQTPIPPSPTPAAADTQTATQ